MIATPLPVFPADTAVHLPQHVTARLASNRASPLLAASQQALAGAQGVECQPELPTCMQPAHGTARVAWVSTNREIAVVHLASRPPSPLRRRRCMHRQLFSRERAQQDASAVLLGTQASSPERQLSPRDHRPSPAYPVQLLCAGTRLLASPSSFPFLPSFPWYAFLLLFPPLSSPTLPLPRSWIDDP